jgi:mannan endo-1,4-beta-mannosidase
VAAVAGRWFNMAMSRAVPVLAAIGLALAVLASGLFTPAPNSRAAMAPLPSRWVGVNVWGLAAAEDVYDCGGSSGTHQETLDATFSHLKASGVDVVRFFAFQSYAINLSGQRDWSALDRVFASAQVHGIHLIPVLGNNWVDCDYWPLSLYPYGGQRKDITGWYSTGYQSPYDGYLTSYRQWVTDVVGRYAGHPSLVAWELINEPRESTTIMSNFITDAVQLVKAQDPVTPISIGCIGHGEPGFYGSDYRTQHALPGVGFATVHDYRTDDPLPSEVATDAAYAAELGKPLFVGEMGREGICSQTKLEMYRAKMQAAFDAGAVGYLLWSYRDDCPASSTGYDFGPDSPMMALLSEFSGPTGTPAPTPTTGPGGSPTPTRTASARPTPTRTATPSPVPTGTSTYSLLVSSSPDRSNPAALEGKDVQGNIYVFTSPDNGVTRVTFYLDDPGMHSPYRTENNPPYDFAATAPDNTAYPFDSSTLANGSHTIGASMTMAAGGSVVVTATFSVGGVAPPPTPTSTPTPDPQADRDADGLTDAEEWALGTDANNPDSDADLLKDGFDYFLAGGFGSGLSCSSGPLSADVSDADGDTLLDAYECYTGPLAGNLDHDGDGCLASEEQLLNLHDGRWYDFFDVPVPANDDPTPNGATNGAINAQDLIAVLKYVGTFDSGPPNGHDVDYDSDKNGDTVDDGRSYDRSPGARPNPPYDAGPPDGAINLQDVVVVQNQVGLDCSGPP